MILIMIRSMVPGRTAFSEGAGVRRRREVLLLRRRCGPRNVFLQRRQRQQQVQDVGRRQNCDFGYDLQIINWTLYIGLVNICALCPSVASYLKELLSAAHISNLNLGLVQTAYANGSSTNYITKKLVS